MYIDLRKVSGVLWPRFSKTLEAINWTAYYKQWLEEHQAPNFYDRYTLYYRVFQEHVEEDIIFLEFGVYKGASLRSFIELAKDATSRFYGFDSFEGLPHGAANWRQGDFDEGGRMPIFNDLRVQFIKGQFQATLPDFVSELGEDKRLVVHIDCDLYSSTLFVLSTLSRCMRPGTLIFFDELSVAEQEFQAFIDWVTSFRISYKVLGTFEKDKRIEGAAIILC